MVLALVPKRDVKRARYTSKAFKQAAIPSLFDTAYVAPNRLDMEKVVRMATHFGPSIKPMRYSAIAYKYLNFPNLFKSTGEASLGQENMGSLSSEAFGSWTKRDISQAFPSGCLDRERRYFVFIEGVFLKCLRCKKIFLGAAENKSDKVTRLGACP